MKVLNSLTWQRMFILMPIAFYLFNTNGFFGAIVFILLFEILMALNKIRREQDISTLVSRINSDIQNSSQDGTDEAWWKAFEAYLLSWEKRDYFSFKSTFESLFKMTNWPVKPTMDESCYPEWSKANIYSYFWSIRNRTPPLHIMMYVGLVEANDLVVCAQLRWIKDYRDSKSENSHERNKLEDIVFHLFEGLSLAECVAKQNMKISCSFLINESGLVEKLPLVKMFGLAITFGHKQLAREIVSQSRSACKNIEIDFYSGDVFYEVCARGANLADVKYYVALAGTPSKQAILNVSQHPGGGRGWGQWQTILSYLSSLSTETP